MSGPAIRSQLPCRTVSPLSSGHPRQGKDIFLSPDLRAASLSRVRLPASHKGPHNAWIPKPVLRRKLGLRLPPKAIYSHCAWLLAHLASSCLTALLYNYLVPLLDFL